MRKINKETKKHTKKQENLVFSQLTDTQAGGNITISHNFQKRKKHSKRKRTIENNTAIREKYIKLPSRHSDTNGDTIKQTKSQTIIQHGEAFAREADEILLDNSMQRDLVRRDKTGNEMNILRKRKKMEWFPQCSSERNDIHEQISLVRNYG